MFDRIISKIAGDYNTRELKKIYPLVDQVNLCYEKLNNLTNEEIKAKTQEFKDQLSSGQKTLDEILPEAFAVVKQACARMVGTEYEIKGNKATWDMVPYDVQLV
jgi:preprotein translocase subunit SecA